MKTLSVLMLLWPGAVALAQIPASPVARPAAATNVVQLTPVYINELAEEMRGKNPALLAARARTNAAAANLGAVRTWEDPVARVGGMAAREELRASDGDVMYGVEQKLPLFSKPKLARRVAQAELGTEAANADYLFQVQRRELAKATFRAALADEVVVIGAQDLEWLGAMVQTMDSRYRANQATLPEVLQLQNEQARRTTQLQTDRSLLGHERVTLNRMLNREAESPWPKLELPPLAGPVTYSQTLVDFAFRYEPKVEVLHRQIRQAEAVVDLTRRQRWPDVSVGLEGRNYTGDGTFRQGLLVFNMNLPWVNGAKYRSDAHREEARLRATEFDLADYRLALREEVHLLTVKIDAARREALLYRDEIIPRSETALASARSGWEANRNTFRDVLDARRMLLEGRLMYARAVAEQYQMLSELVLCCGLGDLEALERIGANPGAEAPPERKTNEE